MSINSIERARDVDQSQWRGLDEIIEEAIQEVTNNPEDHPLLQNNQLNGSREDILSQIFGWDLTSWDRTNEPVAETNNPGEPQVEPVAETNNPGEPQVEPVEETNNTIGEQVELVEGTNNPGEPQDELEEETIISGDELEEETNNSEDDTLSQNNHINKVVTNNTTGKQVEPMEGTINTNDSRESISRGSLTGEPAEGTINSGDGINAPDFTIPEILSPSYESTSISSNDSNLNPIEQQSENKAEIKEIEGNRAIDSDRNPIEQQSENKTEIKDIGGDSAITEGVYNNASDSFRKKITNITKKMKKQMKKSLSACLPIRNRKKM